MGTISDILLKAFAWPLRFISRKAFYYATVKPLESKIEKDVKTEYGAEFVGADTVDVRLGTEDVTIGEYSNRVFVPYSEVIHLSDKTEAILVQEIYKKKLFPNLVEFDSDFRDAVVAIETTGFLETQKHGERKADDHYRNIRERQKRNPYLETVGLMKENNELKPLFKKIKRKLMGKTGSKRRYNARLNKECKQEIELVQARYETEIHHAGSLDTISNQELVTRSKQTKSYKDLTRLYTADEIVKTMARGEKVKWGKYRTLSYFSVAKTVFEAPGQTISSLRKESKRHVNTIHFAIGALLAEGNGLGLIERRMKGKIYRLYPSPKFKELAKKYAFESKQKDLYEYIPE